MKGLAIFLWVIAGIFGILIVIGTFETWIKFFGAVGGSLFSVFLFPIAVAGQPIGDGIVRHNFLVIITGYIGYGITYGLIILGAWLYGKAQKREGKRLLARESSKSYLEPIDE